jgi:hypothetical protein
MRKSTVQLGLNCIIAGIVSVILASYYHQAISGLLSLTGETEASFVFYGLFGGGLFGGVGVIITAFGFLRAPSSERNYRLTPSLIILIVVTLFFFMLFLSFFNSADPQRIRPDETISV